MSKYEWEWGEIKIPSKVWPKFRTAVITAWNNWKLKCLDLAVRLQKSAKDCAKLHRGVRAVDEIERLVDSLPDSCDEETRWVIRRLASPKAGKLLKPLKKDLKLKPTSKDCVLEIGEAAITLINKDRVVEWNVPENNHACETIHEHPVVRAFFELLEKIEWTRGTGGQIIGNDEYNRDAGEYEAGGGGSYVKFDYHRKTKKERLAETAARRREMHFNARG